MRGRTASFGDGHLEEFCSMLEIDSPADPSLYSSLPNGRGDVPGENRIAAILAFLLTGPQEGPPRGRSPRAASGRSLIRMDSRREAE
jgi:hypothetical protein